MKRFLYALSFFILLAVAWHMAVRAGFWSPVLLPAPESVANYLWSSILDETLAQATLVTIQRLLVGYSIVIVVIGLLLDKILFSPWETFLHRRWGTTGA